MLQLSFVSFKKGTYILVEGKLNVEQFYIIQSGQVRCNRQDNIENPDHLGPGDFIGVISCMSGRPQIENAIAVTDVVCIAVRKDQYPELIQQNTPVALKIIKTFASRMRVMNNHLTAMNASGPVLGKQLVSQTNDQLFKVGQFYDKKNLPQIAFYCYFQYLKTAPQGENADAAKKRFAELKMTTNAPYLVPNADMLRKYPKGTMIMCEAQSGNEMFIIQEGNVRIVKIINGEEVTLALLKKGDMFGEMALLENKPRSASAIAHENCQLMTVNRQNFDKMVASQAQLVSKLTMTLSERLLSMSRQLSNAKLSDPIAKFIDMLSLQFEKSRGQIGKKIPFNCDLTPNELATMCGVTERQLREIFPTLMQYKFLRLAAGDKIYVNDTEELVKEAALRRKQLLISKA